MPLLHCPPHSVSNPWASGQALPHLSTIKTGRVTSDQAEVRETPRLVVDRLKGNVFVNQYLIIKDLGRGAHGTVKLVFDTEDQTVYAMKVIHRKAGHRRRNSYSIGTLGTPGSTPAGSPYTAAAAAAGPFGSALGATGLVRGHSMSADACNLAAHVASGMFANHSRSSSPFAGGGSGGPFAGQQLQAFGSASGSWRQTFSGSGSRPSSSCGQQLAVLKEVQQLLPDTEIASTPTAAPANAAAESHGNVSLLVRPTSGMEAPAPAALAHAICAAAECTEADPAQGLLPAVTDAQASAAIADATPTAARPVTENAGAIALLDQVLSAAGTSGNGQQMAAPDKQLDGRQESPLEIAAATAAEECATTESEKAASQKVELKQHLDGRMSSSLEEHSLTAPSEDQTGQSAAVVIETQVDPTASLTEAEALGSPLSCDSSLCIVAACRLDEAAGGGDSTSPCKAASEGHAAAVCFAGPAANATTTHTPAAKATAVAGESGPAVVIAFGAAAAPAPAPAAVSAEVGDTVAADRPDAAASTAVPDAPTAVSSLAPALSPLSRLSFTGSSMSRASSGAAGPWGTAAGADAGASPRYYAGGVGGGSPLPVAAVAADAQTAELVREMAVMKKLNHPHVVTLHEVVHDPDAKLLIMVMEYMPGGPILSSVGQGMTEPLPEVAARRYFRELVSGLDYLHSNLIMHGDLKPDNLLLSAEGHLKISDFGSAAVLPSAESLISTTLGTPAFMAPEMCGLKSRPFKPFPAECWALGVCLYMFVFGRVPYVATSAGALYEAIRAPQPVQLPERPVVSDALQGLLHGLLDKNPETRTNLAQVCADEWVTDSGRLPPLVRCCEQQDAGGSFLPVGVGLSRAEQNEALTGLKQQVKDAIPSVEERTYRKGQVLVQQGQVPEGLFLILRGTCELVLVHLEPQATSGDGSAGGVLGAAAGVVSASFSLPTGGIAGLSPVPKKESDMDFAGQLSSSSDSGGDEVDDCDEDGEDGDGSYSPLANSFNHKHYFGGFGGQGQSPCAAAGAAMFGAHSGSWAAAAAVAVEAAAVPAADGAGGADAVGQDEATSRAAEVADLEQVLPQLLPASRWLSTGVDNGNGGSSDGATAGIDGKGGTSCSSATPARAAAASAGPVMMSAAYAAAYAAAAAAGLSGVRGESADGGCSSNGQRRARAMSLDCTSYGMQQRIREGPSPQASLSSTDNIQHLLMGPVQSPQSPYSTRPQTSAAAFFASNNAGTSGGSSCSCSSSPVPPAVGSLRYHHLSQASAPDLRQLMMGSGTGRGFLAGQGIAAGFGGVPGSPLPAGLLVQRSASSATMGRAFNRAMRRSESMHKRMKQLVVQAKMLTEHNMKRQELVGIRGPGQVVGDTSLGSRAQPASATVRARGRMKVLLVRRADAAALKHQPGIKAALYRTQTESSVLDVLETFATYDNEVTAIDELRKSLAAASSSFSAAAQLSAIAANAGMSSGSPLAEAGSGGFNGSFSMVIGGVVCNEGAAVAGGCSPPAAALGSRMGSNSAVGGLGYNAGSFSALGALRPTSRGNSFSAAQVHHPAVTAAVAATSGVGGTCSAGSGQLAGGVVGQHMSGVTSPSSLGLSSSSSFVAGHVGGSALPSRGSSSTRFALSAGSSNISPMPSGTAASLAAAANAAGISSKQPSQRLLK